MRRSLLEEAHPDVIESMVAVGFELRNLERDGEALEIHQEALKLAI